MSIIKFIDLSGERYGRLVVVDRALNDGKRTMWNCVCDCGNRVTVRAENLRSGNTKSCGCIEKDRPNRTTHGLSKSRINSVFNSMKQRCYNKNNYEYANYGGRGIKICDEWLNDRRAFYRWAVENGYDDSAEYGECTIDRIDVNGDYCPENCRFVDLFVQANNTRKNKYYMYCGEKHTLAEWARIKGIKYIDLYMKINRNGLSIEEALTE